MLSYTVQTSWAIFPWLDLSTGVAWTSSTDPYQDHLLFAQMLADLQRRFQQTSGLMAGDECTIGS